MSKFGYGYGNFDVISDGHVDRKIVQEMIDATIQSEKDKGHMDDIRQYQYGPLSLYTIKVESLPDPSDPTSGFKGPEYIYRLGSRNYKYDGNWYEMEDRDYEAYFPISGITGVQYIDLLTKVEYNWDINASTGTAKYVLINDVINSKELHEIFEEDDSLSNDDLEELVMGGRPVVK